MSVLIYTFGKREHTYGHPIEANPSLTVRCQSKMCQRRGLFVLKSANRNISPQNITNVMKLPPTATGYTPWYKDVRPGEDFTRSRD